MNPNRRSPNVALPSAFRTRYSDSGRSAASSRLALLALLLFIIVPNARAADTLSLTLADAIALALKESPAATQAQLTSYEGASILARGINNLLPSVSGSITYAGRDTGASRLAWTWSTGLSVSQVIFSPSAFSGLVSAAVRSSYSSISARNQTARLIYDVAADYLGLLKTSKLRQVASAALERAAKYLEQIEEKRRLGMVSSVDLLRARVQESQARLGLLSADRGLAVAQENLKATLGLDRLTPVAATESLDAPAEFEIADPDSLIREIERTNPGVQLAARSRTIADAGKVAAFASVLPSVSLSWSSSYSGSSLPSSLREWRDNDNVSYGLRASLPLLDLKSYVLDVVDANNASRRARASSRATQLQIRATAADAVIGYEQAREQYDLSRANLELNQRLHDLADEQLKLGAITMVDYLAVDADLVQAQSSLISATCDTYIQAARISYLMGSSVRAPD